MGKKKKKQSTIKTKTRPKKKKPWWMAVFIAGLFGLFGGIYTFYQVTKPDYPLYEKTAPNRLGVVTLTVGDLEKMETFYTDVIGLKRLKTTDTTVSLTADGETPLLLLEENTEAKNKPNPSAGLYHFALLLPDRASLGQVLLHLNAKGALDGAGDHQYSEALYLTDPEGNGIEIYADRPSDTWKTNRDGTYIGGTNTVDVNGLITEAGNKTWNGLPAGTKMGHLHLQVTNLADSKVFYIDLLDFDVVAESNSHLFVSKYRYHHDIGMNIWAGEDIPAVADETKGIAMYTLFFSKEDWLATKKRLQAATYAFSEKENVLYVSDPSNIHLRIEQTTEK